MQILPKAAFGGINPRQPQQVAAWQPETQILLLQNLGLMSRVTLYKFSPFPRQPGYPRALRGWLAHTFIAMAVIFIF
jgi:hypothetical protein